MSQSDFDRKCGELCEACRAGVVVRRRSDTGEFVHDTAVEIPGTLGKRMGHFFCTASDFRKENARLISGQS